MSALDLAALRGLCERATDGPWEASGFNVSRKYNDGVRESVCVTTTQADAEFIAAARTALPAAVAEIERLRARVGELETALRPFATMAAQFDNRGKIRPSHDEDAIYTVDFLPGVAPSTIALGDLRAARVALRACPGSPLLDGGR